MRLGTVNLIKVLQDHNHKVLIYTTSFRSIFYIKLLFSCYGIFNLSIINQKQNIKRQSSEVQTFSKNPKLFNIDLHIDDLLGVEIESRVNNSNVLILNDSGRLDEKLIIDRINYLTI